MELDRNEIITILQQYLNNELDEQGRLKLEKWTNSSEANKNILRKIDDANQLREDLESFHSIPVDIARTLKHIQNESPILTAAEENRPIKTIGYWLPYVAAILLVIGGGIGTWIYTKQNRTEQSHVSDIKPAQGEAYILLADGSRIDLNESKSGIVVNKDGIVYTDGSSVSGETVEPAQLLLLQTSRGGTYQIVLSDGTKVWLNASSSLRYPTVFDSNSRMVQLKGEAYFEVSPNKQKPFIVKTTDNTKVEVLGTHFNINNYANEKTINTTLIEGSVRVQHNNKLAVLKPGMQARIDPNKSSGEIAILHGENIDQVLAWKKGVFNFDGSGIEEIMKQLERWYDIEVNYAGNIPQTRFFGEISREESLSDILNALKESGIRFKLKERRLTILSN
ncbi:FecR family protein [Sphingobacterium tabacisoli]|uniref:FecR family protein n=1 Tax=Sphingobacterium tabacisoli TaxID=2044855 RepID=A0ABW5L8H9_9SPHI|nr:FecR family protein [Sphingobacterium tabacisoli]